MGVVKHPLYTLQCRAVKNLKYLKKTMGGGWWSGSGGVNKEWLRHTFN